MASPEGPETRHDGAMEAPRARRTALGHYTVLEDAADHKVKTLLVYPGKRLSYQRHRHRGEHWFVVRGTGKVTLDGVEVAVRARFGGRRCGRHGPPHREHRRGRRSSSSRSSAASPSPRTTSNGSRTTSGGP